MALFVANATDRAVFMVSCEGLVTYWNVGAEAVYGYVADAVIGRPLAALSLFPSMDETAICHEQQQVAEGGVLRRESWCTRCDGSEWLGEITVVPLRMSDGSIRGYGYSAIDITRRRAAEERLEQSEDHMRSVLATIPDAMVVIDERGTILSFSAAAERMFGYTEAEMLGANVNRLMPPENRAAHVGAIHRYLQTGERRIIGIGRIVVGQRRDGSTFPIEAAVGEAIGRGGRIFTGFLRDLSNERRAELRLKELQAELIHVSRLSAMGTMASTLAHELNQPLTAVANYMEAARDLLDGEEAERELIRDALTEASGEVLRAGTIVRRLREFVARGETQQRAEDLPALIRDAMRLGLIGARERGVHSFTQFDPTASRVLADRIQVQQVIVNLLRNAVDAVPECVVRDVTVSTERDGDRILISVTDTGPGLDAAMADRLFQAFTTSKEGGMGLGLSICRTIVEAHGGRIWVVSGKPGRTRFTFSLKAADQEGEGAHE